MKRWTLTQLGMLLGCSTLLVHQPAQALVYENGTEFLTSADCDGDGRLDAVIVNKSAGSFRVGYQISTGIFTWSGSRSSGLEQLTGFSVGTLLATNYSALAFTAPEANRVLVVDARNHGTASTNYTVFTSGIGPATLIAIDIPMTGNTALDDLFLTSTQNDPHTGVNSSNAVHFIQSSNGTFTAKFISSTAERWLRGNRFYPRAGASNMSCVIARTNGQDRLRIAPGSYVIGTAGSLTPFLSGEYDYAADTFGARTNVCFLMYEPGSTTLRMYPVNGTTNFSFGTASNYTMSAAIGQIFVVPAQGSNQLLIVSSDGTSAATYAFDGFHAPTLLQSNFTIQSGCARFTGALPTSSGEFLLLSGTSEGVSMSQERFAFSGGVFVSQGTASLPSVPRHGNAANVFAYKNEPFVAENPVRLGSWRAGDWTTNASAGASVQANYLTDQGKSQGLRPAGSIAVGTTPAGTTHTLASQPHEAISVFSFDNAYGTEFSDLRISPAPGCYPTSIQVTLTNATGTGTVYYRLNNEGWVTYTTSFWLYADTVVAFYAAHTGSVKSALSIAAYTFTQAPGDMDSDHDGVPDYVEIGYSLDPVESGLDADGDGLSDLEEILQGTNPAMADSDLDEATDMQELRAGTNPNDELDTPALPITNNLLSLAEQDASYDLLVTLRPKSYQSSTSTYAMNGTQVRAYDMDGGLLAFHVASNLSYIAGFSETHASVLLQNIPIRQNPPFTIVNTEPNYPILYGTTNNIQGREMLTIYHDPDPSAVTVSNTYAGGNIFSEAIRWADAARDTYSNATHQLSVKEITIYDTLTALLFENELGNLLYSRGVVTNAHITLFPFRIADMGVVSPGSDDLLALESDSEPGADDAWLLLPILTNMAYTVTHSADSRISALRSILQQVYNTSSRYSATNPGVFRQPVDVMRDFIRYGTIDAAYTNAAAFSSSTISLARQGATLILSAPLTRPTATFSLEYRTNSLQNGVVTLWTTSEPATPKQLYAEAGKRYAFPQFFNLLPGMIFEVTGYTDLTEDCAPAEPIQVTGIGLSVIPNPVADGSTGTNLPAAWQLEMFGSNGHDALADDDADGFCNLHEYLAATHAGNSNSTPAAFEFNFERGGDGVLHMDWAWWENYVSNFVFEIQGAYTPGAPFSDVQDAPIGEQSVSLDPASLSATNLILRIKVSPRR